MSESANKTLTSIYGSDWKPSHKLKTHPEYFQKVWDRLKLFEIRKDDRDFREGQSVLLEEWKPERVGKPGTYSGRWVLGTITVVVRDVPYFGLREGFCVFGFNENFRSSHDEGI